MESLLVIFFIPLILSLILSKLVINWLGRRLLDIPNNRSSHSIPTPRGGGAAIVAATLITLLGSYSLGSSGATSVYLLVPGVVMALVGISDDLLSLNIRIRLLIQLITACIAVGFVLNNTAEINLLSLALAAAAIVGIVWLTNLYNFMDGINGIAALQTIFICGGMSALFFLQGTHSETIPLMLALGGASLGFLYWNFPLAKLFMGDVGSLCIGMTFAILLVWTSRNDLINACTWLIMLTAFIADATYTLGYRFATGQKFYLPHRSHFYQKIAIKLGSHTKATLLIMGFNLLWPFPLAAATLADKLNPVLALLLAYLPAVYLTYRVRAGKAD